MPTSISSRPRRTAEDVERLELIVGERAMKFCWTRASLLSVRCPIDSGEEEWLTKKQACSGRRSGTEKEAV